LKTLFLLLIIVNTFFFNLEGQNLGVVLGGDSLNYIDKENNKQGFWKDIEKRTEGHYVNNEKEGIWKSLYMNGSVKSEISYLHGEKMGYAKIYYENGQIAEEGTWMGDKWTGKYKSYYKNGRLSYLWNYNEKGNRSGYQKYFYENGNIRIEGKWIEGKEEGLIKEYYSSGILKSEKMFFDGKYKANTIMVFLERDSVQKNIIITKGKDISSVEKKQKIFEVRKDTIKIFSGTGKHILYNKYKKPEREGVFVNGILQDGKHYFYDENGDLKKTAIYKLGKVIEVIIE